MLDFLISPVWAQAQAPAQEPGFAGLILPLGILLAFFFLFVVPQQRRAKEQKKMIESLNKGTEVITNGGLLGKVVDLDDNFVLLELADNVQIHVQKQAISTLLPKGTYKSKKKADKA